MTAHFDRNAWANSQPPDPYDYDDAETDEDYRRRIYQDSPEAWGLGFNEGLQQGLFHNSMKARLYRLKWRLENRIPLSIRHRYWNFRTKRDPNYEAPPF